MLPPAANRPGRSSGVSHPPETLYAKPCSNEVGHLYASSAPCLLLIDLLRDNHLCPFPPDVCAPTCLKAGFYSQAKACAWLKARHCTVQRLGPDTVASNSGVAVRQQHHSMVPAII